MFTQNRCLVHYCKNSALSTFDENGNLKDGKNYCIDHISDPGKFKKDVYSYIHSHDKIVGLNATGLLFSDIDISNKQFFGCNFSKCSFINVKAENLRFKVSIFDFSTFNDCMFVKSNALFCSFSGSIFTHTLLTSSEIIQSNFNGIKAFQSSFDDSDLYNSRFILAELVDTSFRNCNLKKANFLNSKRTNISFKMSNTREAIFNSEPDHIFANDTQFGNSIVDGETK